MTKSKTVAVPKAVPKKKFKPMIGDDRVLAMHVAMLRVQTVATELRTSTALRRFAPAALLAEGSFAGMLAGLKAKDVVVAPPEMWQAAAVLGVSQTQIVDGLRSKDAITDGTIVYVHAEAKVLAAVAAGAAAAAVERERVVVAFAGDVGQEQMADAVSLAMARDLPLILVSFGRMGTERRTAGRRGTAAHLPGMVVDGRDAMAVHRVAQEAVMRARTGLGGTFVRCILDAPGGADPVQALEQVLLRRHLFSESKQTVIRSNSR